MTSNGRYHRTTTQRGVTLVLAAAAVVLLAAGCGSGKTKASTATPAPAAAAPAPAAGNKATVTAATTKLGQVLVNAQGMTLYTFDPENAGGVKCLTGCVDNWPPDLVASGGSAPSAGAGVTVTLATITRPDGGVQVSAGGHPLYMFSGDKAPGDTNGNGIGGKWHVATPSGSAATAGTPTTSSGGYRY
jgi:predicted lipoprotein with Yx(FWY)xxD motif